MKHYGEKEVTFKNGLDGDILGMRFQVTDVKKPLLAVRRLTEKGNIVQFGGEAGQSFIANAATGKKIMMEKRGGSFVIKAQFVKRLSEVQARKASGSAGFARQAP